MASFDGHAFCARCRDKKKGTDMCVESPTKDCKFCLLLTPEQKLRLATPSYKLKKEKRDAKKAELSSPSKDGTLVDPSTVSVIGAVSDKASVSSPPESVPEKKAKKDKPSATKPKKTVERSSDKKMEELDRKWSDRFNRLEAVLMSKSFPPTFSSAVKVTPTHSPPSTVSKDTEPFFSTDLNRAHWPELLCYASVCQPAQYRVFNYIFRAHWIGLLCFIASAFQPAQI